MAARPRRSASPSVSSRVWPPTSEIRPYERMRARAEILASREAIAALERSHSHSECDDRKRPHRSVPQRRLLESRLVEVGAEIGRKNSSAIREARQLREARLVHAIDSSDQGWIAAMEEYIQQSSADSTTKASLNGYSRTATNILPLVEAQRGEYWRGVASMPRCCWNVVWRRPQPTDSLTAGMCSHKVDRCIAE